MDSAEEAVQRILEERGGKPIASSTQTIKKADAKKKMIDELLSGKNLREASAAVGRAEVTTRLWRAESPEYAAEVEQAIIAHRTSQIENLRVDALTALADLVKKRDRAGVIFANKALNGMSETSRFEHTGSDGGPIQHEQIEKLSDDELNERIVTLAEEITRDAACADKREGAKAST